jgi:hypothetical protein
MGGLGSQILAALVVVLVLDHFNLLVGAGPDMFGWAIQTDAVTSMNRVDRSHKGQRLLPSDPPRDRTTVVAIEIVGLHETAIVYRDREGRTLYRSDPLTNTTIVAKNVDLPQVTVRDRRDVAVQPAAIEVPRNIEPANLPIGCESIVGVGTDPSLRGLAGRCMTQNAGESTMTALN